MGVMIWTEQLKLTSKWLKKCFQFFPSLTEMMIFPILKATGTFPKMLKNDCLIPFLVHVLAVSHELAISHRTALRYGPHT
jgi:hypothetical protein